MSAKGSESGLETSIYESVIKEHNQNARRTIFACYSLSEKSTRNVDEIEREQDQGNLVACDVKLSKLLKVVSQSGEPLKSVSQEKALSTCSSHGQVG